MNKSLLIISIILMMSIISCVSTGKGKAAEALTIELHAIDAQLKTDGALVYEAHEGRECVGWWESPDDEISWDFDVAESGEYSVIARVACATSFAGSLIGVTAAGQSLTFKMPDTYEWPDYVDVEIGNVMLEAGPNTVKVQGIELVNRFFGNLQLITFKKVG